MSYEIHHFTLFDGWVNTWTDTDDDGTETPTTFKTEAEAEVALQKFLDDWKADATEYHYSRDEFRIVKI